MPRSEIEILTRHVMKECRDEAGYLLSALKEVMETCRKAAGPNREVSRRVCASPAIFKAALQSLRWYFWLESRPARQKSAIIHRHFPSQSGADVVSVSFVDSRGLDQVVRRCVLKIDLVEELRKEYRKHERLARLDDSLPRLRLRHIPFNPLGVLEIEDLRGRGGTELASASMALSEDFGLPPGLFARVVEKNYRLLYSLSGGASTTRALSAGPSDFPKVLKLAFRRRWPTERWYSKGDSGDDRHTGEIRGVVLNTDIGLYIDDFGKARKEARIKMLSEGQDGQPGEIASVKYKPFRARWAGKRYRFEARRAETITECKLSPAKYTLRMPDEEELGRAYPRGTPYPLLLLPSCHGDLNPSNLFLPRPQAGKATMGPEDNAAFIIDWKTCYHRIARPSDVSETGVPVFTDAVKLEVGLCLEWLLGRQGQEADATAVSPILTCMDVFLGDLDEMLHPSLFSRKHGGSRPDTLSVLLGPAWPSLQRLYAALYEMRQAAFGCVLAEQAKIQEADLDTLVPTLAWNYFTTLWLEGLVHRKYRKSGQGLPEAFLRRLEARYFGLAADEAPTAATGAARARILRLQTEHYRQRNDPIGYKLLREATHVLSSKVVAEVYGIKPDPKSVCLRGVLPGVYVEPGALCSSFADFCESREERLFGLLAESGAGKSAFFCHEAERLIREDRHAVLLMDPGQGSGADLEREGLGDRLWRELLDILAPAVKELEGGPDSVRIETLRRLWRDCLAGAGRQAIVLWDALDEYQRFDGKTTVHQGATAIGQLHALAFDEAAGKLRIAWSMRLDDFKLDISRREDSMFPPSVDRLYLKSAGGFRGLGPRCHFLETRDATADGDKPGMIAFLKRIYSRVRQVPELGSIMRPLDAELPDAAAVKLRQPFDLLMLMEVFHGAKVEEVAVHELMRRYLDLKLSANGMDSIGGYGHLADRVFGQIYLDNSREARALEADLAGWYAPDELDAAKESLRRLQSIGVLGLRTDERARSRHFYFSSVQLYDYFLYRLYRSRALRDRGASLLSAMLGEVGPIRDPSGSAALLARFYQRELAAGVLSKVFEEHVLMLRRLFRLHRSRGRFDTATLCLPFLASKTGEDKVGVSTSTTERRLLGGGSVERRLELALMGAMGGESGQSPGIGTGLRLVSVTSGALTMTPVDDGSDPAKGKDYDSSIAARFADIVGGHEVHLRRVAETSERLARLGDRIDAKIRSYAPLVAEIADLSPDAVSLILGDASPLESRSGEAIAPPTAGAGKDAPLSVGQLLAVCAAGNAELAPAIINHAEQAGLLEEEALAADTRCLDLAVLRGSAAGGNSVVLEYMLSRMRNPSVFFAESFERHGYSPIEAAVLACSAAGGNSRCLELLLRHIKDQALINTTMAAMPLIWLVAATESRRGESACLRMLLGAVTDTGIVMKPHATFGASPIMAAAHEGSLEGGNADCLSLLLAAVKDPELAMTADRKGLTPFHAVAEAGARSGGGSDCLETLFSAVTDPGLWMRPDEQGMTPIALAAMEGSKPGGKAYILERLLDHVEDVELVLRPDRIGRNPIHLAIVEGSCPGGNSRCLELLLARVRDPALIMRPDHDGNTPVWTAINQGIDKTGGANCLRPLLEYVKDPALVLKPRDKPEYYHGDGGSGSVLYSKLKDMSPLAQAAWRCSSPGANLELLGTLLEAVGDPGELTKDVNGSSAINFAVFGNNPACFDLLLSALPAEQREPYRLMRLEFEQHPERFSGRGAGLGELQPRSNPFANVGPWG